MTSVSIASRVHVHTATLQVRVQILDRRANGYLSRYSGLYISFINSQFSFSAYSSLLSRMSSIVVVFLGALQASLAVLLTIGYGAIASRWNLLKASSSRDISKACVRLFLPALLITNVGSELHADTAIRYVPVLSKCPPKTRKKYLIRYSMGSGIHIILYGTGLGITEDVPIKIPSLDDSCHLLQVTISHSHTSLNMLTVTVTQQLSHSSSSKPSTPQAS